MRSAQQFLRRDDIMTDQELTLQALSNAQPIFEEYLGPSPHDNESLLGMLVEVLDRNDMVAAVSRLRQGYCPSSLAEEFVEPNLRPAADPPIQITLACSIKRVPDL